jgi:acyl-CoA synthetase (AMP-forming)/AMP-acid ligase II
LATAGDFYRSIERFGDAVAVIGNGRSVSYVELASAADRFAEGLPAERSLIFLECHNTIEAIAAYLACLRKNHVVHLFGDMPEDRLSDLIERYRPAAVIREHIVLNDRSATYELHEGLRVLLSTSGSTGSPKFVKLSENNLFSNAESIAEYLELTKADRAVTSLKFNYSYGMSVINSHFAVGGSLVLTEQSVVSPEFWTALETSHATSFAGVPYTFELLAKSNKWAGSPGLRYVTQAGGRLSPELVSHFTSLGDQHGWRFFVMYGQTEASPRMAYLPPEVALSNPECIGVAVPGGQFSILSEAGTSIEQSDTPGELVYSGPNVMMGYAEKPSDLGSDEAPDYLKTGDIAVLTDAGLYRIVGRMARMVKPFGVRLNLDELQAQIQRDLPGAVCTGNDEQIVIAAPDASSIDLDATTSALAGRYNVPPFMIAIVPVAEIPQLPSGKPDYRAIMLLHRKDDPPRAIQGLRHKVVLTMRMVTQPAFYQRVAYEAAAIVGLVKPDWQDVRSIYAAIAKGRAVLDDDTFSGLAGDSLSYIQTSLALEAYLGLLPENWETLSVADLEGMRSNEAVA